MKNMSSNRDLYEYLLSLSVAFKERGLKEMSDTLDVAIGQASSSSTEFLGESRIALRRLLNEEAGTLTVEQRGSMADVLRQLDEAFDKR